MVSTVFEVEDIEHDFLCLENILERVQGIGHHCPITLAPIYRPARINEKQFYEWAAIQRVIREGDGRDPITRQPIKKIERGSQIKSLYCKKIKDSIEEAVFCDKEYKTFRFIESEHLISLIYVCYFCPTLKYNIFSSYKNWVSHSKEWASSHLQKCVDIINESEPESIITLTRNRGMNCITSENMLAFVLLLLLFGGGAEFSIVTIFIVTHLSLSAGWMTFWIGLTLLGMGLFMLLCSYLADALRSSRDLSPRHDQRRLFFFSSADDSFDNESESESESELMYIPVSALL